MNPCYITQSSNLLFFIVCDMMMDVFLGIGEGSEDDILPSVQGMFRCGCVEFHVQLQQVDLSLLQT